MGLHLPLTVTDNPQLPVSARSLFHFSRGCRAEGIPLGLFPNWKLLWKEGQASKDAGTPPGAEGRAFCSPRFAKPGLCAIVWRTGGGKTERRALRFCRMSEKGNLKGKWAHVQIHERVSRAFQRFDPCLPAVSL